MTKNVILNVGICKVFRAEGATYGKNPSKKQTYFGFKVHAITTSGGAVKAFEITPANVDDRTALEDLSLVTKSGSIIIGDKGYVCEPLAEKLKAQGQTLLTLKRNNARKPYPLTLQQGIFRKRRRIETTFSQMTEQLNVERVFFWLLISVCYSLNRVALNL